MLRTGIPVEDATSNKKLVVEALGKHELRYDGRTPTVTRPLAVTLSRFEGAATAEFSAGRTRVLAHVAAELVAHGADVKAITCHQVSLSAFILKSALNDSNADAYDAFGHIWFRTVYFD